MIVISGPMIVVIGPYGLGQQIALAEYEDVVLGHEAPIMLLIYFSSSEWPRTSA